MTSSFQQREPTVQPKAHRGHPAEARGRRRPPSRASEASPARSALLDFYRCPEMFVNFTLRGTLSSKSDFFYFGENLVCYGQSTVDSFDGIGTNALQDLSGRVSFNGSAVQLPFDPSAIVENLRRERYTGNRAARRRILSGRAIQRAYYVLRPLLAVAVRKHLQRLYHRGWERLGFPKWPVDRTVEDLHDKLLLLCMKARGSKAVPFIWFWPEGAASSVIMTHDVETKTGLDFLPRLMDIDDSFGIKASVQVVPQKQYRVPERCLRAIRDRRFELNVQDLNHDGSLFSSRLEFLDQAVAINHHVKEYRARGFRAGRMHRNADWVEALDISYDMSVPNVAHLEAQRGGCCTVFPYFIGKILELPLTTIEDYCLFNILGDHSLALWQQQISLIRERHGLVSFIVHPDYIRQKRALEVYQSLLGYLSALRDEAKVWIALPGEVDHWWRQRSQMKLIQRGSNWQIEGPGKERARLAYAILDGDHLVYSVGSRNERQATDRVRASLPTT